MTEDDLRIARARVIYLSKELRHDALLWKKMKPSHFNKLFRAVDKLESVEEKLYEKYDMEERGAPRG